jgi:hypothetical protein
VHAPDRERLILEIASIERGVVCGMFASGFLISTGSIV